MIMLSISPLDWTDLNPAATPFIPRNFPNNQPIERPNTSKCTNRTHTQFNSSVNDPHSTASGSKQSTEQKANENSKSKKKSSSNKPSNVTLEQFILEKLRIDQTAPSKVSTQKKKEVAYQVAANSLDSSAPTRKRGKERETPKPKKPTTLKKIIIQEKNALSANLTQSKQESNDKEDGNAGKIKDLESNDIDLDETNRQILHCKAYREYCCQSLTQQIDNYVVNLLSDLIAFQDRMHARDPLKAKIRKRLCFGFREVSKYASINKVKMLIVAPDIEKIQTKGGLDDTLTNLLDMASTNLTPIVFALNRRNLGITCKKKGYISCIGVLNYDGSQDNYKQLVTLCENARMDYDSVFEESKNKLQTLSSHDIEDVLSKLPSIPSDFLCYKRKINPNNRRFIRRNEKTSL